MRNPNDDIIGNVVLFVACSAFILGYLLGIYIYYIRLL